MHCTPHAIFGILLLSFTSAFAQMGEGWKEYQPKKKIHLVDFENKEKAKGMSTFPWKPRAEVGKNSPASSYAYDTKTLTETFTLHDKRANRS